MKIVHCGNSGIYQSIDQESKENTSRKTKSIDAVERTNGYKESKTLHVCVHEDNEEAR